MPIEYTSDESKKKNSVLEKYLYLRYILLGFIGSLIVLLFSFAALFFLIPIFICGALLAIVELKRTDFEEAQTHQDLEESSK